MHTIDINVVQCHSYETFSYFQICSTHFITDMA